MSTQSAAKSLILEFVKSPEFEDELTQFMLSGSVAPDNLLGILRQFVISPLGADCYATFWRATPPPSASPEHDFTSEEDQ